MAAAPQRGGIVVMCGGSRVNIDVYASDVAGGKLNLGSGGAAASGSETFWKAPQGGMIVDFYIHTGMTDTTAIQFVINNAATMSIARYAAHLDTSNARPTLGIPFNAGELIGAIQLA